MTPETSVAIVGLGSRGLGVLERLVTLAKLAGPDAGPVRVEVIDPTCSGAGVHEVDQPDYLLLNTTASAVSHFPDACTVGEAVDAPGMTLHEWVTERGLRIAEDGFTVGTEGRPIRENDFLPRRVLGEYLCWFHEEVLRRAPAHVSVRHHRATAVDLEPLPDGSLLLTLSDGTTVRAGHAFLTTGYTSNTSAVVDPAPGVVPAPYPLPSRTDVVAPGESVAIGGFGLSAMDLMSCLTVGRGGRFVPAPGPAGYELRYEPSGREPQLFFHSRSGVPCRARPRFVEFGPRYRPLLFTHEAVDAARAAVGGPLDFDRDVLPLLLDEMRVAQRRCQARLAGRPAPFPDESPAAVRARLDELDAELGPFDAAALFDGTGGMLLDDAEAYQKWLADLVALDLAEGLLGFVDSEVKAALDVMRELRDTFRYVVDYGGLTAASLDRFTRVTVPAVNRAVVGPQFERHAELLALMAAGVAHVPFGPAPTVEWTGARWLITSTRLSRPYAREVDWVANAHVEPPAVATSASPLLAALHRRGLIRRHQPSSTLVLGVDVDPDMHLIDAGGRPDPRLWALGPLCEGATFYNNLVPSPNMWSRPLADAHRCVSALYAATRGLPPVAPAPSVPSAVARRAAAGGA
ncbi:MAG TPA: FAD/NAD(P)-binding protein, partial [Pseudonocardiaceae bacterium]